MNILNYMELPKYMWFIWTFYLCMFWSLVMNKDLVSNSSSVSILYESLYSE